MVMQLKRLRVFLWYHVRHSRREAEKTMMTFTLYFFRSWMARR
jgi:hypothetical protein